MIAAFLKLMELLDNFKSFTEDTRLLLVSLRDLNHLAILAAIFFLIFSGIHHRR